MAKKVLLVDDDKNNVKFLAAVLHNHGYETDQAPNGREGQRKARQMNPDLIVLDVMMPEKSGLLVCAELKQDEDFQHIPILMLTGVSAVLEEIEGRDDDPPEGSCDAFLKALKTKVRELREAGVLTPEMFVDKPVDPEAFIARVRELIGP